MIPNDMSADNMTQPAVGAFPPHTPVGMAYVPLQKLQNIYTPEQGFNQGTIFPDLDLPFLDGGGFKA